MVGWRRRRTLIGDKESIAILPIRFNIKSCASAFYYQSMALLAYL
jgi:hypothetical protein